MNRWWCSSLVIAAFVVDASAQPADQPADQPIQPSDPPVADPTVPVSEPTPEPAPAEPLTKKEKKEKKEKRKKAHKPYAKPHLYGFMQTFFRYSLHTNDPTEDPNVDPPNFRVQRVRVMLDGGLLPWLSYKIGIDPRAPEITGILRDAYFDVTQVIPSHKLRVGQQKTQFGYENNESSSELFYVNRAELSDALGRGQNLRDIGVGLLGRIKLGGGFRIEDAITVVNGAGLNQQDDNNRKKNVFGRIGVRYKPKGGDTWVRAGISGARGDILELGDDLVDPADDVLISFLRVGADLELDTKWLFAAVEVAHGREKDPAEQVNVTGWYVNLVGKTPYPVGPLFRVDAFGDEFRRFTFGAYYGAPSATFRVLLNYELRQLKDDVRGDDRIYVWTQVRF